MHQGYIGGSIIFEDYWLFYTSYNYKNVYEHSLSNVKRIYNPEMILNELSKAGIIMERDYFEYAVKLAEKYGTWTGKWVTFSKIDYSYILFFKIIEKLEEEKICFQAKIIAPLKLEQASKGKTPLIFYVPHFLDIEFIVRSFEGIINVIKKYKSLLNDNRVIFKPDVFTLKRIYGNKEYIYYYTI